MNWPALKLATCVACLTEIPTGSSMRSLTMGKRTTEATARKGSTVKVMRVMMTAKLVGLNSRIISQHRCKYHKKWKEAVGGAVSHFTVFNSSW